MELIIIGYVLDLLFGDPYWIPHPIRFIGQGIKKTEELLRKIFYEENKEKIGGVFLTAIVVVATYLITFFSLKLFRVINPLVGNLVSCFWIFQILATKSLAIESRKVIYPLKDGDILEARKYLSYIVGRDTTHLDEKQIIRATVETVAENISDGIIAPLFYILIGGVPLGMAYKAINTLDSMVGYKNEKYIFFGWASAKIDDLANYIPARITATLIVFSSSLVGFNYKNSLKVLLRDRRNHKSPNAGYPESAVAGALEVQLGGTNIYFGKPIEKPTIGDKIRNLEIEDINKTIKIMYMTSFTAIIFFALIRYLIVRY